MIICRSNNVRKPLENLKLREYIMVNVDFFRIKDLPEVYKRADIITAALGKTRFKVVEEEAII